jgi:3-hydroxyacyl-[acyl-carrier-protein] dehydratase
MNNAAHWTVPADHPVFAGHFPGAPIVPGVMLLDTVLHAIAAATGIALDVCEIRSVKFLSPARPGDELALEHILSASGTIGFDIVAGRRRIASGSIVPGSPV